MSFLKKLTDYFTESLAELKKVQWLSRKQTTNYTIAVFALSVGIAVFFAVLDYVLSKGLDTLIQ